MGSKSNTLYFDVYCQGSGLRVNRGTTNEVSQNTLQLR